MIWKRCWDNQHVIINCHYRATISFRCLVFFSCRITSFVFPLEFGRSHAGVAFEELRKRGLVGEIELKADLLKRQSGCQHGVPYLADNGVVDEFFGRAPRFLLAHLEKVADGDVQPVGEIAGVAVKIRLPVTEEFVETVDKVERLGACFIPHTANAIIKGEINVNEQMQLQFVLLQHIMGVGKRLKLMKTKRQHLLYFGHHQFRRDEIVIVERRICLTAQMRIKGHYSVAGNRKHHQFEIVAAFVDLEGLAIVNNEKYGCVMAVHIHFVSVNRHMDLACRKPAQPFILYRMFSDGQNGTILALINSHNCMISVAKIQIVPKIYNFQPNIFIIGIRKRRSFASKIIGLHL